MIMSYEEKSCFCRSTPMRSENLNLIYSSDVVMYRVRNSIFILYRKVTWYLCLPNRLQGGGPVL